MLRNLEDNATHLHIFFFTLFLNIMCISVSSPSAVISYVIFIAVTLVVEGEEQVLLCILLVIVCGIFPLAKWWLQRYKKVIIGPWDIAHLSAEDQF